MQEDEAPQQPATDEVAPNGPAAETLPPSQLRSRDVPFNLSDSIGIGAIVISIILWVLAPTFLWKAVGTFIAIAGAAVLAYRSHWTHPWRGFKKTMLLLILVFSIMGLLAEPLKTQWQAEHKTLPAITWKTPSAIEYGTPLSAKQLNATAFVNGKVVEGTFVYNPTFGDTLPVGTQTLSVTFTPNDADNYFVRTSTVALVVRPSPGNESAPPFPVGRLSTSYRREPPAIAIPPRAESSGSACVPPPPDPTITFIFKSPLLHDEVHKCQISGDIIAFRRYLTSLGFQLPARALPVGISPDGAMYWQTGSTYGGDMLLIGQGNIEDRVAITAAYASMVVRPPTIPAAVVTSRDRDFWNQAHLIFA